jgi:cytoskeletal protein RodZ
MGEVHIRFGRLLTHERERQGLKLDAISEELKISEENLSALEDGDTSRLPAPTYFRLFARSYSEYLGIDFTATLDAIRQDVGEVDDETLEPVAPREPKRTEKGKKRRGPTEDAEGETEGEEEEEKKPKRALMASLGSSMVIVIAAAVYFVFFMNNDGSGTSANDPFAEVAHADAEDLANYQWAQPAYTKPEKFTLKLTAREESWATVVADGDTALFRTLSPWREFTVEAEYRMVVSIAHPSVVQVSLNGTEVNLTDPESRRVSREEINQANLSHILSTRAVSGSTPAAKSRPSTASSQPAPTAADTAAQESPAGDSEA